MVKLAIAIGMLVVGALVLCGMYLLWKGGRNVQMALASPNWPKTPGVVVYSKTTREVTPQTRRSRNSEIMFATQILIGYAVDGKEYTTDVLHFGQTLGSGDKSEATLLRLRYPEGKEVTVSYNPANHARAVVKPGLHSEAFWLPGVGLAFLLPAALMLIMGPAMLRGFNRDDRAFADSVHSAMEDRGRQEMPAPPVPGSDASMSVAVVFFGAVVCALGVLALTAGAQRYWHGAASVGWPTTPGVVVFAGSGRGETGDDATNDTSDLASDARMVYEYEVAGTKHLNNVRRFAQVEGGSAAEMEHLAARYHKGAHVTVSYFPTDPDVSVLEPGNTSAAFWMPGIGVALLLFGAAIFYWMAPSIGKPVVP